MENKHNYYDLAQMQSLNLESKISMSTSRIIDWYEYYNGNVFVAISGGKDSKNGLGYWFVIDWLNEHGHYNIKY